MGTILLAIFILLIILIIFLFIYYYVQSSPDSNDRGVNQSCISTGDCVNGLICDNKLCKVAINGHCESINDCVSGATACQNNICIDQTLSWFNEPCSNNSDCESPLICYNKVCKAEIDGPCNNVNDCIPSAISCTDDKCVGTPGGLNDPCPCEEGLICDNDICKVENGGNCSEDDDCSSDSTCKNGTCQEKCSSLTTHITEKHVRSKLIDHDTQHTILDINDMHIIDVSKFDNKLVLLCENSSIFIKNNNSYQNLTSSIKISKITNILGKLHGLSNGTLYIGSINKDQVTWLSVNWYNSERQGKIYHFSISRDNNYIWLQAKHEYLTNTAKGYLYHINSSITPNNTEIKLENNTSLPLNIIRSYGTSKLSYIDLNTKTKRLTRYPKGDKYKNIHKSAIRNNGQLISLVKSDDYQPQNYDVRIYNDIFVLSDDSCYILKLV